MVEFRLLAEKYIKKRDFSRAKFVVVFCRRVAPSSWATRTELGDCGSPILPSDHVGGGQYSSAGELLVWAADALDGYNVFF